MGYSFLRSDSSYCRADGKQRQYRLRKTAAPLSLSGSKPRASRVPRSCCCVPRHDWQEAPDSEPWSPDLASSCAVKIPSNGFQGKGDWATGQVTPRPSLPACPCLRARQSGKQKSAVATKIRGNWDYMIKKISKKILF